MSFKVPPVMLPVGCLARGGIIHYSGKMGMKSLLQNQPGGVIRYGHTMKKPGQKVFRAREK